MQLLLLLSPTGADQEIHAHVTTNNDKQQCCPTTIDALHVQCNPCFQPKPTRCMYSALPLPLPAAAAAGASKKFEKAAAASYGGNSGPGSYNYGYTPSWSGGQSPGRFWQG
jgi:hypothetical protein